MQWLLLTFSFLAGAGAGAAFLAGLWWTTRQMPTARRPALLAMASLLLRMAMLLSVFWLIARTGRWEAMLAALAGFVLVRTLAVSRVRAGTSQE